jgi:hypothetical protein
LVPGSVIRISPVVVWMVKKLMSVFWSFLMILSYKKGWQSAGVTE